jgi:caspase domain-containing protein
MRHSLVLSLACASLLLPRAAHAGGVYLRDITIDGRPVPYDGAVTLGRGTQSSLCFALEGYSYSARPNEDGYLAFSIRSATKTTSSSVTYFALKLNKRLSGDRPDDFQLNHCVPFQVPSTPGRFLVHASLILMFPSDFKSFDTLALARHVRQHFMSYEGSRQQIARLVTRDPLASGDIADFETYLRLDGKVPASEAHVVAGVGRPPVIFSWYVKPAPAEVEHHYRLFPTQKEWTDWDTTSHAAYYFIPQGAHQLQVVSRVKSNGQWIEGRQAQYQFFLTDPLIAKPIAKGTSALAAAPPPPPDPSGLYVRSRALVIGVTAFDDPRFIALPFTGTDVDSLSSALRRQGFTVGVKRGRLTRAQIAGAIDSLVRSAAQRERLVIYLSTHGFSDRLDPNKGYVASTDCHPAQPHTCLSLREIDDMLQPVLQTETARPVQHLLLLLDACSAGLGVIDKAGGFFESSVAARPGSHIMTAGLADQKAEQDPSLRPPMSTFTYFVTKGLNGAADYTGDGVISLSELLVYVRYNVAAQTQSRQTPMMGRIHGAGEMVFTVPGHPR